MGRILIDGKFTDQGERKRLVLLLFHLSFSTNSVLLS